MDIQQITIYVIIVSVIGLLLYDLYAYMKGGTKATISYVIVKSAYSMPLIAFFWGLLTGHFFWRLNGEDSIKEDKE